MAFNPKDIKLYIDSGWRTVPYDSITYNDEGKKVTKPMVKWKPYVTEMNTEASPAGALICGEQIVVDCDTIEATQEIIDIAKWPGIKHPGDLLNDGVEDLIGLVVKTSRGYHFFFNGDEEIPDAKGPKIDIQATNKKLVYLASEKSEGKKIVAINKVYDSEENKATIHLTDMPKELKGYILSLKDSKEEIQARKTVRYTGGVPLAKIEKGTNQFFKRMTPKDLRSDPMYRKIIDKRGYILPDDIEDGGGNDYIIAVAGILATDPTIDINNFYEIFEYLNDQWTNPLSLEHLQAKITPYAEGKYEGCPFNYDEDWEKATYSFVDVDGNELMLAYDLASSKYIVAEIESGNVYLKTSTEVTSYYANRTGMKVSANDLATFLPGVKTEFNPLLPFGLSEENNFNTYKHNKYLTILNETDAKHSKEEILEASDCLALKFFEHLFREQTEYYLQFLKRKLTSFDYSSTVFCLFDMEGGAGKGALETFLGHFVGTDRVVRIDYEAFKAKFTSDMEGKLFIFLNEFPDDYKLRKANTDRIKDMTGSPLAKIEKKGLDVYTTTNYATYMVTSNRVSVEVKDGDRRFCISNCDKKFDSVFKDGYFKKMISEEELSKLAIYLKYNVKTADYKDYMQPPTSLAKEAFKEESETGLDEVIKAIVEQNWDILVGLDEDIVIPQHNIIDLKLIAERLNLTTRRVTTSIKTMIKLKGLNLEISHDRNHKYRVDKVLTFIKFKRGSMEELAVKEDKPSNSGVVEPKV